MTESRSDSRNSDEKVGHDVETAALLGVHEGGASLLEAERSLEELKRLVTSAGDTVVDQKLIRLRDARASTLISKGHLEELGSWLERIEADVLIIDDDLTPVQQRNLIKELDCRVVTRTEVILDIFATHARTREAMTQVELAQLRYFKTRLIGAEIASAKMGGVAGGIATRGPGETQLEIDRRTIRVRIQRLEQTLEKIEKQRATQRRQRQRTGLPLVGLVGYTNAGKSTLLNRLTNAGVLVEDRLFSTLDTTVRSLSLPGGMDVGLIDTVGFVSKLPPTLVAAFRATLEELVFADVILHVVDATSPRLSLEFATTDEILRELKCENSPRLVVWNKIDQMEDPVEVNALTLKRQPSVAVSALEGRGMEELLAEVEKVIMAHGLHAMLRIPYSRYDLAARLHRESQVIETRDTAEGQLIRCRLAPHLVGIVEPYRIEEWPAEEEADAETTKQM